MQPIILTVANTAQYGYGVHIAPDARPDDGWLDLCLIEDPGLQGLIQHSHRLLTGTIDRIPGVQILRTRKVRIERHRPSPIQVDGDEVPGEAVLEAVCEARGNQDGAAFTSNDRALTTFVPKA
jgi:diacylglycerol kinase family enzyme